MRWASQTRAIHAGQAPDPSTGAVNVPIYQTSTFAQHAVGQTYGGYEYARTQNPTRKALETCIASLEGGKHGLAFASGMAAETTLCYLLQPGDHVVLGDDVYGGTYRLFARVLARYGIAFDLADLTNPEGRLRRFSPRNAPGLAGDPDQSLAEEHRYRAARGPGASEGRVAGRGQHLRLAVSPAPAAARRGFRGA